ncbi:MAG: zinc-ribbon domain-containing protein [Gemmatales bacterium]|nr:zinc-ribbon domain-containing protein [Gemmatales bacterium]
MPLAVNCGQCQVRLRVADHLVGKKIRCPKCQTVFLVPNEEPRFADYELVDEPPETSGDKQPTDNTVAPAKEKQATKLKRKKFKKKKSQDWQQLLKMGRIVLATVLGLGVGIYLLFVFLGLAGTASKAFAEFADIMEQAATAMENARDPSQCAAAAQQLQQQAQRLETWVSTYAHEKEQEAVLDAALRRYGPRIERAAE